MASSPLARAGLLKWTCFPLVEEGRWIVGILQQQRNNSSKARLWSSCQGSPNSIAREGSACSALLRDLHQRLRRPAAQAENLYMCNRRFFFPPLRISPNDQLPRLENSDRDLHLNRLVAREKAMQTRELRCYTRQIYKNCRQSHAGKGGSPTLRFPPSKPSSQRLLSDHSLELPSLDSLDSFNWTTPYAHCFLLYHDT